MSQEAQGGERAWWAFRGSGSVAVSCGAWKLKGPCKTGKCVWSQQCGDSVSVGKMNACRQKQMLQNGSNQQRIHTAI